MIYILIALVLGLVLVHLYLYHGRIGKFLEKLQGPALKPVVGNLWEFQTSFVEMYDTLRQFADKYYPAYRLFLLNKAVICIRHPDDLEILLNNPKYIRKEFGYEHVRPWLHTGLLTSDGEKWHQRRKILTPAFHFNILKKYNEITNEQGEKTIEELRSQGDEITVDLNLLLSDYTLNIICDSAMGVSLATEGSSGIKYKNAIHRMGNIIIYRMMNPWIQDWMLPFMPKLNKEINEVISNLDNFIKKIVDKRREYHKSTNYEHLKNLDDDKNTVGTDAGYYGQKKRLAMLDLLLAAEQNGLIDDTGIKHEVATFVFEGHDTTAISLIYTVMLFAENKDAQDRAREEIAPIMERKGGKLELADINEMNYLDRCIKESLRLFPSVPSIGRYVHTQDLKFSTFIAPKGCHVTMHIVDVHRDPNFWPEPSKFDPDRFLPELVRKRHPFSYVPFSAGSRNCIGQKFAMMELKSFLSRILYNYHLEPVDLTKDVKVLADLVLRPAHPVHTKFVKIHHRS